MFPDVFKILDTPEIQAFVGNQPARIYDFGRAHQNAQTPYIVHTQVTDSPHDQISGSPLSDFMTVQVDCYSKEYDEIRALAKSVRNAFDAAGYANRMIIQTKESDTQLYRISFEVDIIENR